LSVTVDEINNRIKDMIRKIKFETKYDVLKID
jgi:hypothetical protein